MASICAEYSIPPEAHERESFEGHSFSCAASAFYSCHHESAVADEGSAFLAFSAAA